MICIHHNDLDGRCSAAIVSRWVALADSERLEFWEMDYKDTLNVAGVLAGERVVIVDFSLKPDVMALLLAVTCDVTWIDHHATAAEYDYGKELKGLRDFTDKGPSGCELTWRYCFPHMIEPSAVSLLGDYDAFRLNLRPASLQFIEGLKLYDHGPTEDIWRHLLTDHGGVSADDIVEDGKTAIKYRDNYCGDVCRQYGYETDFAGLRCFATNIYRFGSQAYGKRMQDYDACIAYIHDGTKFTVSMYADDPAVDVSVICKAQGGGGHKGAAGFVCASLPFAVKELRDDSPRA